ncbi:hypothetical protein MES5069_180011 [Mesorhizobium escarrei]|uniref:Uncharacterized protein n=1 Tax=Mesorhizobium escarrei TaxID=666018 RepID=A0ABN8JJZ6_9HYPH|nr:hypothetical protein MES5069_180011 [Mesorhizobium escarrei]
MSELLKRGAMQSRAKQMEGEWPVQFKRIPRRVRRTLSQWLMLGRRSYRQRRIDSYLRPC